MKGALVAILLLLSVSAFELDQICERSDGESCMNSQDCPYCNVSLSTKIKNIDLDTQLNVSLTNGEPEELPLIFEIKRDSETLFGKTLDLSAWSTWEESFKIPREKTNYTIVIEVRDRDIGSVWAHDEQVIKGLNTKSKLDIFVPLLSILLFFGILYRGIKSVVRQPKRLPPPIPAPLPPPTPQQQPSEEIVVVRRKKKYYYKK